MEQNFQTKPKIDDVYVDLKVSTHRVLHVDKNCEVSINEQVIFVDTSVSDVIVNIPNDDKIISDGKFFIFKDEFNTSEINNVIINPNGLDIDLSNCFIININGDSKKVIYSKIKKKWYSLNN